MYFFHGIPQTLTLDSHAIEVRRIPKVPFFVILTETEIFVYQLHPLALISKITKSQDLLVRHGKNKKIAIGSEYGIIAVATENNFIAVYYFHLNASEPLLVPTPDTERYDDGPGEILGPIACSVQYKMAIRYDGGVSCLEVQGDSIVYSAYTAPIIQVSTLESTDPKYLWKVSSKQYDLREVTWFLDHKSLIRQLYFDRRIDTFFWMSTDGRVYANIGVSANTNTKSLFGVCIHNPKNMNDENDKKLATALSTNARFSLLYVGTSDGSVYAYEIQDFGRKYVCSHYRHAPSNLGSVTHISTASDGFQIMVGYESAWISYSPYLHPCSSSNDSEFFKYGFYDGFWDKDGCAFFGLRNPIKGENRISVEKKESLKDAQNTPNNFNFSFVQEDNYAVSNGSCCLYILPFLKSTITNSAYGTTNIIGVQSSDRLFISKAYSKYNNLAANFGSSTWIQVEYPQTYISAEWPIRYTAISKSGDYIAIAGFHGFAAYDVQSRIWNVFDNGSLEQSLTVTCPMIWHEDYLIVGLLHESNFELHIYDIRKKLDDGLVDKFAFTSTIVTISLCDDAHLLVYTADNYLHHIYIERLEDDFRSLFLSHVSSVSFVPVFTTPSRVRTITLLTLRPFLHSDPSQLLYSSILLVLINGKLVTLDPIKAGPSYLCYRCCILSEDVEFFMINEDLESPALYHSMWIMTGNGFRLSMAFGEALSKLLHDETTTNTDIPLKETEKLKPYNTRQLSFIDDLRSPSFMVKTPDNFSTTNTHIAKLTKSVNMLELFNRQSIPLSVPGTVLSVIVKSGLFVSASTLEHKTTANNMEYCHIQIDVFPFLSDLLKALLLLSDIEYAVFLVRAYASLHFIDFVLEKLLSIAAECTDSDETLLTNVAVLFNNIKDMNVYKYVLGCLRKIETHFWPNVFKHFGDAQTLMDQCLRNKDIKNAARCIIIWQVHKGSASCAEVFLQVLKTAFEGKNWEVCTELCQYLASLDPTKQLLNSALISAEIPCGQIPMVKTGKSFNELMRDIDNS
ncbi:guanyl-nucleotide exchange factor [Schizosaccharomyces cryophilus OY26]|uniref:Guanyl-nucleotide exchange factor n=1 Tax=Schizosaccharomyces cryophilus (strain OY26 / ATCC MYA-4695 / CBS 11777 / NBRC 106824 / NRRL Y48691) TaxID=653667 RepID=S9XFG0_SCHCR|nr:guanyl-nucleotide exchange factor [Schizosaccharomyces cryophilus OY26]EPY52351.1 guanyl-nucleotide exchange factor [Schizosaccharomyces cryophilus OY26]